MFYVYNIKNFWNFKVWIFTYDKRLGQARDFPINVLEIELEKKIGLSKLVPDILGFGVLSALLVWLFICRHFITWLDHIINARDIEFASYHSLPASVGWDVVFSLTVSSFRVLVLARLHVLNTDVYLNTSSAAVNTQFKSRWAI